MTKLRAATNREPVTGNREPRLGAHMSVAGGLPLAVDRAVAHRCDALQIFAKNANQWKGRVLPRDEIRAFRSRIDASGIASVVSHASYLINLAADGRALRRMSLDAMGDEIDRAEALGLLGVVLHPGCYTSTSEAVGLRLIAEGLLELLSARRRGRTMVLLEHTAGQGTSLGASFEQIAAILGMMRDHARVGVCLDTCHLLAAGYDITTDAGYADTFVQFERLIGFDRLKAFHLNDSKRPLGSRVDRHEHIGQGFVGLEAFRRIVNDRRFRGTPMMVETPKTEGRRATSVEVDPLDERNLNALRALIARPASAATSRRR
ncbi:MAG TPA: deoxyribonuclease IV [Vicinamibacterales bacterium]|nr:deoxyribonuclease IV [Vicinamibacterales bacterium]